MILEMTDRQREIIDVSLELINEKGIQGLTIKNLAKKIGFSESAIYRHYENKIQILLAILDFFKEGTERFFANELNSNDDAMVKINRLFMNQFEIFTNSPSLVAVIFSEELFRNEAVLAEKVNEVMNNNLDTMAQIIQSGQDKGEIRADLEAAHLSLVVMGTLRLYVKKWHISNYSFNLINKGGALSDTIETLIKK